MAAHAPLSHQLLFHHYLGGDAGVVTARVPQGGLASHPVPGWKRTRNSNKRMNTSVLLNIWLGIIRLLWTVWLLLPSGQTILNGVGESMTQVKWSCHIRWRDAHHEDAMGVLLTNTLPLQNVAREKNMLTSNKMWYCVNAEWEGGFSYPILRLEESLLLPPWIPGCLHILRTVGVRKGTDDIWHQQRKRERVDVWTLS